MPTNLTPMQSAQIEIEIPIKASRSTLWSALVNDIGKWWPKSFHASRSTQEFKLEPMPGGRLYEDGGEGRGVLW